jgi:hypothetical protein
MAKSYETRVEVLERADVKDAGIFPGTLSWSDFILALEEGGRRAIAGGQSSDVESETQITAEILKDPVHGKFYRQLHDAWERVRLLRQ